MSIVKAYSELEQQFEQRRSAIGTALTIAKMNVDMRESLAEYLSALNVAQRAGDDDEQQYIVEAIVELFVPDGDGGTLENWEREIRLHPGGKNGAKEIRDAEHRFFRIYHRLKEKSGLTIRELAEASGLSPTTVNAIEKERVKPQHKTLVALANAFKVSVEQLIGQEAMPE